MASILKVKDANGNVINIPAIQGDSAYKIAVKNGFEGTEAEWLESLNGSNIEVKSQYFASDWTDGIIIADAYSGPSVSCYATEDKIEACGMKDSIVIDVRLHYNESEYSCMQLFESYMIPNIAGIVLPSRLQKDEIYHMYPMLLITSASDGETETLYNDVSNSIGLATGFTVYYIGG